MGRRRVWLLWPWLLTLAIPSDDTFGLGFVLAPHYNVVRRRTFSLLRAQATNNTTTATPKPLKFDARLEEMHSRKGQQLTQSYCDSVLGLCVASDEWDSVLDVLEVMKQNGLSQQRSTYRACLQECFELGNFESASSILSAMKTAQVEPDAMDISLVVSTMCRNSNWKCGMDLLLREDTPRVVPVEAYDAVLSCMPSRKWKDSLQMLHIMETFPEIHPTPILSTYRAVIETCVSAQQAEQAFQVLISMPRKGFKPTVYKFELVISALTKTMQWRRALQLFDTMDELNIPKTVVTYNTVISACARAGEVGTAKNLLQRMKRSGISPNIISFNAVMTACASTSRWKDALHILDQCHYEPGVQPDIITYTNAMRACSRGGKTNKALTLLQVVKDKKLPIDNYCYTAVIDACAKAKMWRKALELLDEMERNGIVANEITYSVAIKACGNGGQWERALALLEKMKRKNMIVNLITYNSAITALSKASKQNAKDSTRMNSQYLHKTSESIIADQEQLWMRALDLLERIKLDGLEPDGFSYSAAISCCGAGGRWKEALDLIKTMQKGGPKTRPNKVAYTAAISACGRSGEHEHALQLFTDMKNEGLQPDRVTYNAVFSALRVSNMPDETFELWGEICGKLETNGFATSSIAPDIITVTDVLATLSRSDSDDRKRVDQVFKDAVDRGIVMRQDTLDSDWEVDLTGMSLPVARAACRFIFKRIRAAGQKGQSPQEVTLITGIGRWQRMGGKDDGSPAFGTGLNQDQRTQGSTALREYVLQVLEEDFTPPLHGNVPTRGQGTVVVEKELVEVWISRQ